MDSGGWTHDGRGFDSTKHQGTSLNIDSLRKKIDTSKLNIIKRNSLLG